MVIVCESKTGFTMKYANMLSQKTGLKVFPTKELDKVGSDEEVIFFGWMKAGMIQGLKKMKKHNVIAICATGTARNAEPDDETVMARNNIKDIPFFYMRGGCLPLKQMKGMDKFLMSLFVKMLKSKKDKDEELIEAISNIENGFDGVKEENLAPLLKWLSER